jgi:hypothetical protein
MDAIAGRQQFAAIIITVFSNLAKPHHRFTPRVFAKSMKPIRG